MRLTRRGFLGWGAGAADRGCWARWRVLPSSPGRRRRWPAVSRALDSSTEVIAVPDRAFDGAALLVSVAQGRIDDLTSVLVRAGASVRSKALVGSHATRYTVTAEGPVSTGR